MNNYIQGIDISPYQAQIDWVQVATTYKFAYVKATEGGGWDSPTLRGQATAALAAGLDVGVYHYAREALSDPLTAAVHHCKSVADLGLTLTHALDLEWDKGEEKLSPKVLVDWARAWCAEVQAQTQTAPIIYTSSGYIGERLREEAVRLKGFGLWVAGYPWEGSAITRVPDPTFDGSFMPRAARMMGTGNCFPWPGAFIWQWTGSGKVIGVSGQCDRNVSTVDNLAALRMQDIEEVPTTLQVVDDNTAP